jgi:hypothetical protein
MARPAGVAGLCHGVCVAEDLWDAYDRMGLSFQQHAAESADNPTWLTIMDSRQARRADLWVRSW